MTRPRLRASPDELKDTAVVLKRALHDPETAAAYLAGLAREFRATLQALEAARPARKDDPLDDLATRRQARRAEG